MEAVLMGLLFLIPYSSYSRKHLNSRLSGNRDMQTSPFLRFTNGISYFLVFILFFIPGSRITTALASTDNIRRSTSPSNTHAAMKIAEYDEFQIIIEAEGTPQTRQEGILHGPLTAVNAVSAEHLSFAERTKGKVEANVNGSKSMESRRKLIGFPLETREISKSSRAPTTPPPLPSSTSSYSSSTAAVPGTSVVYTSTTSTASTTTTFQYSMQVSSEQSRSKRSANDGDGDDDGGGGILRSNRRRGKGRALVNELKKRSKKVEKKLERLADYHGDHPHPPSHQNSVHKRAATISPPFLFLKIFMDYSSPNEDDKGSGGKGKIGFDDGAGSQVAGSKRRRSHRSFRTSPGGIAADHSRNESSVANNKFSSRQRLMVMKSRENKENSSLLLLSNNDGNGSSNGSDDGGMLSQRRCVPASSSCPDGHFACKSNSALCVPQSAICNGKPDCPDGSDEDKDCVNIHEKNFWDNYFKKRPAADVDDENANGNGTCRYNASRNADEELVAGKILRSKLGKDDKKVEHSFYELLASEMCMCSQEKVFCHNVHLPNLLAFPEDIQFLDLSGSHIDELEFPSRRFDRLETLVLSSCAIREISADTFSSLPNLKVLHLTGNHLKRIPPSAFAGSANLSKLFLGHNHLEALDSESFHGLYSLEYLDLRKNRLTGEDSNVFHALGSLRTLHLNYNEIRSISKDFFIGLTKLDMLSLSKNKISMIADGTFNHTPRLRHLHLSYNRLSVLENNIFCNLQDLHNLNLNDNGIIRIEPRAFECLCSLQSLILQKNPFRELTDDDRDIRSPREPFANLINLQHIYFDEWWMCWWAPHVRSCEPKGDGISSVDNLLDNVILRVCVWIMGLVGVGGNVFVIISRIMIREKNRAHSFYIKNLAVADLLMGLFLISIAFHDLAFRGHFLAHQHAWRHSITCQLSGMLSTLSSEASVFILFLITLDRYLSIVRPFAERTNALIPAVLICTLLWAISIFLSYAPLCPLFRGYFGRTFYTSNGLCLPLHIHNPFETGWEYSLFLFIAVNSVAFIFICYAYWKMLRIIQMSTTSIRSTQQKQDGMLVKRFGLVVVTDFLCWAPIIVIKCIAMAGVEIQSNLYAWLAVFVLPVNSALNPVIYTLSTKLFKQQVNPPGINRKLIVNNVSHFTIGFRKRLGLATDDSTTSSLLYRNRISRTLQTSLNSSMMLSTRRHAGGGGSGADPNNSTRVTVLRDRMGMANRMSSKVGSYSPPSTASVGNVAPVVVTGPLSTSPSSLLGREHILSIGNGGGSGPGRNGNYKDDGTSSKTSPTKAAGTAVVAATAVVAEINGQIIQQHQPQQYQQKVDGNDKKEVVVESQL